MTDVVPVPVRQLDPELPLPAYAHPGDAGADLVAAADVELPPGGRALVPTGVAIALPEGYVGLVHPRSGLAARLGVTVLNAPGTVDAGYRGEILVNLINHDRDTPAKISRGDRIAQLVVQRVARADFQPAAELAVSRRGTGGHGSTGGHAGLVPSPATVGAGGGQDAAPDGRRAPDVPDARREERDRAGGRTEEVAG
ncbi:dUTP diphosphatase [Micromonospora sp. NPDC023633]|uniref:dUTP diphosphatase n=1 Tax=unclassified Micromonospora TaxID=2617518 RepID=UPI0033D884B1